MIFLQRYEEISYWAKILSDICLTFRCQRDNYLEISREIGGVDIVGYTDVEKALVIHDYLALHIKYDYKAYLDNKEKGTNVYDEPSS